MKGCDRSMFKSSRCMHILVIGIGYKIFFSVLFFVFLFFLGGGGGGGLGHI